MFQCKKCYEIVNWTNYPDFVGGWECQASPPCKPYLCDLCIEALGAAEFQGGFVVG